MQGFKNRRRGVSRVLGGFMLAAMLTLCAATAAQADDACSTDFRKILDNRADALRVRDKALQAASTQQADPTLGVTCFDQALGVTSRLGKIFSDKLPAAIPAANTKVFTSPLSYPNFGADTFLIQSLQSVITQPLEGHLQNFDSTISAVLGTNTVTSVVTDFISGLLAPIQGITSTIQGFIGDITGILDTITKIEGIAKKLSLPLPAIAILPITTLLDTLQATILGQITALTGQITGLVTPAVNAVLDQIMGPATEMSCDHIKKIYSGGELGGGSMSLQGTGSRIDVGYDKLGVSNFLNYASGAPSTSSFDKAIKNTDIISGAMGDLTGGLAAPGGFAAWQTVPVITLDMEPDALIGQM